MNVLRTMLTGLAGLGFVLGLAALTMFLVVIIFIADVAAIYRVLAGIALISGVSFMIGKMAEENK